MRTVDPVIALPRRRRGSVFVTVFALVFIVAGLAAGIYFASSLFDWIAARSWEPVPATLHSVNLDSRTDSEGTTTYRVEATYTYDWRGERFTGSRVDLHGSDNLGDWHHRLHSRLQRALRAGEPVTAWVDPDDPSRAVLERGMRWGRLGFGMIFPAVFGGFGLLVIWAVRRGRRETVERERLQRRDPGRPWMWEAKWRTTELESRSGARMWVAIGFALFWNLVSAPVAFLVPGEVAEGNHPALLALLFPAIGIGLIVWAVRAVIRRRRYGDSRLRLDALPVPLGGQLRATLEVPARLQDRELDVRLACVHRYRTGTGKNRKTRTDTLWEDRRQVAARSGSGPGATSARIELWLPHDQPVAREQPSDDRIVWELEIEADEPGVDYRAIFELPVFETDTTAAARADPETAARRAIGPGDWEETGVVHDLVGGGQRFRFPRFRMAGAGLVVLLFALVFGGAGGFLIVGEGALIFGGIFALAGLLILWGAITMIFQRSEIVVGLERLRWRHGVFGGWQEIDAGGIESIDVKKSGSAGKRLYYRIQLKRFGEERRTTIADWVPGHRPAQALARRIAGLAGVRTDASAKDGSRP